MEVQPNLEPTHKEKNSGSMKAERAVKRITFNPSEANPGETLRVCLPKLNENEVIVPGTLSLVFDLDLSGGDVNNFVVQNVSRALVEKFIFKSDGVNLQQTSGYDLYKIWEDLFLSKEERESMLMEGIQSEALSKIRSNAGDKPTSGVDAENSLETVFKSRYRIRLDHQILNDHGVDYPRALYNDLSFELTLAPASLVVKGSDASKLVYKLKNIELEYTMIRNENLAEQAQRIYELGKSFMYDHVERIKVVKVDKAADTLINLNLNAQRRSMKGVLLLFIEPYASGTRHSEKFFNPDITKVTVTINGAPNKLYSNGLLGTDVWDAVQTFFSKKGGRTQNIDMKKFYTGDKYALLVDLRSMDSHNMHGSGTRALNSNEGVQLAIERKGSGSGSVNCHVYVISDAQMDISERQFKSVMY